MKIVIKKKITKNSCKIAKFIKGMDFDVGEKFSNLIKGFKISYRTDKICKKLVFD